MLGRVKLTTQALEESVAPNSPLKRAASVAPSPVTKKRKAPVKAKGKVREKVNACTYPGCEKAFTRPCRLEEHIRSHTGERPYKCIADPENCDKSFLRDSHLKAHVKALHLKEKPIRCTFIIAPGTEEDRGVFGFKRKAPRSAPSQNGVDGESPRECGATFSTNQQLKRHLESHMKNFPHVCTEYPPCSEGFRKRGPLRRHIRSEHLKLLPWGCMYKDVDNSEKECIAAFDTKGKLGGHIDTVHRRMVPARYTCAMCVVSTGNEEPESAPEKDITVESGKEVVVGEEMPLGSKDSSDDESMENLNSGSSTPFPILRSVLTVDPTKEAPDPETARLKGKIGFKTYLELRRHTIQMHPPTCAQCKYTFKSGKNLKDHIINIHRADVEERKKFMCEQCGTGFTKKHALKVHIRCTHEGLRPFACLSCSKTYGYKAQLQIHVKNHHSGRKKPTKKPRRKTANKPDLIQQLTGVGYEESGRNIRCVVDGCDYRFFRMYDLKIHLSSLKHHGFDESQVEELVADVEGALVDCEDEDEESSEEDEYMVMETDSSGSGSDESDAGMGYADLWDGMSDMDLDGEGAGDE